MKRTYIMNHEVKTTEGTIVVTSGGTAYLSTGAGNRRLDSQWFSSTGVLAVFVNGKEIRLKSTPDGLVQE